MKLSVLKPYKFSQELSSNSVHFLIKHLETVPGNSSRVMHRLIREALKSKFMPVTELFMFVYTKILQISLFQHHGVVAGVVVSTLGFQ